MKRKTCLNCLKGFDAKSTSRIKYCGKECRSIYQKKHNLRRLPTQDRRAEYLFTHCDGDGCFNFLSKLASEAKKQKQHYCSRDCYSQTYRPWDGQEGGRKRKRPGGKGLPPHAQPETVAAHERWPVRSWFDDNGYTLLYMPDCPYTPPKSDRIYEHRLIMSLELGRRLERSEHVDHIVPLSEGGTNERSNLQVMTPSDHARKTANENVVRWSDLSTQVKALGLDPAEALEILRRESDSVPHVS